MWFFSWFQTYFESLRAYFQNTGDAIYSVPILGSYLSTPFTWIASFFANLSTASSYASSWSDSIASTANAAYTNALNAYNAVYGWVSSSLNSLTSQYNSLSQSVNGWVTSSLNSLNSQINSLAANVNGWITSSLNNLSNQFNSLSSSVNGWISQTITNLTNQYNSLVTQIQQIPTGESLRSLVLAWITAQMDILTLQALEFIDTSWKSFESPLVRIQKGMIKLVSDNAILFADPLWQCTDIIVGKLTEYEGK